MKNILEKVLTGIADANIRSTELRKLVLSFGFKERIKGDRKQVKSMKYKV